MENLKRLLATYETITAVGSDGEIDTISAADQRALEILESAQRILMGGRLYSRSELHKLLQS